MGPKGVIEANSVEHRRAGAGAMGAAPVGAPVVEATVAKPIWSSFSAAQTVFTLTIILTCVYQHLRPIGLHW